MNRLILLCATLLCLAGKSAHAQADPNWLGDMMANELAFQQQFYQNLDRSMGQLMAMCEEHIRRTGTPCLQGYDAKAYSSEALGYDAYNKSWADNQARTDAAMDRWGWAFNGQAPYTDRSGATVWAGTNAVTAWQHPNGTVMNNMTGHLPPDPWAAWQQLIAPKW